MELYSPKIKKKPKLKLSKLIFLFTLVILAVGCNKDDGSTGNDYNKENLEGSYKIPFLESKKVETVAVNGFDVVTTTTSVGDTSDFSVVFASNNTVTTHGTYTITETRSQGSNTETNTYLVMFYTETREYSANESTKELTMWGSTYKVSNFTNNGFTLNLLETTTEPNGDNTVYTEELRLERQ